MKRVVVIGASPKPHRYSYKAALKLQEKEHKVFLIGKSYGTIGSEKIHTDQPALENIHTITVYLRPELQGSIYDYILSLKPERLIFNPGSENPELVKLAKQANIESENACTLVLLSTGGF